jgi:hypothetical protein
VRVSHRDTVEDMLQKGRDLEKVVLSCAMRWHLEDRIWRQQKKTVVFAWDGAEKRRKASPHRRMSQTGSLSRSESRFNP